jgi:hypothetical protein
MVKQRGYPDRRGMGAESDFISEQFVPNERYKMQQLAAARDLIAGGLDPELVAKMFVQLDLPSDLLSKDLLSKDR